jgi:hypothetical protein
MEGNIFRNEMAEAVFRQAVADAYERKLDELAGGPDVEISERHERRTAALFRKERRRARVAAALLWAKRTAAAAASLFVVLGCAMLLNPSVRASVGGAVGDVVKWAGGFTSFGQNGPGDGGDSGSSWRPAYLPDGFAEESSSSAGAITAVRYSNGGGEVIEFTYVPDGDLVSVSNEGVERGQETHGGVVYHTFEAAVGDLKSSVVWVSDGWLFNVAGYQPIESLLEIALSAEAG